jgi:hypothetical protein
MCISAEKLSNKKHLNNILLYCLIMAFECEHCNNVYKSLQSYRNHIKIKHNDIKQDTDKKIICEYCNKNFTRKTNLRYHIENSCKNKTDITQTINLQNQINELKKELDVLKHIKEKPEVINNITNNITNNGTIINNTILINKTGTENLLELTDKECDEIFSKEILSVVSLIKHINFNERLPSNHSFCSKSLEGKYLLSYDVNKSCTESLRKKYFCHELVENSVSRLEILYEMHKNKMSKLKQTKIENNIKMLKNIKNRDYSDKILKELNNQIIELSYNNKDTVLNTWKNNKTQGKKILKEQIKIENYDSETSDSDSSISSESDSDSFVLKTTKKNTTEK